MKAVRRLVACAVLWLLAATAYAQSPGEPSRREYESLDALLSAAATADARVFEALADIGAAPALGGARAQLAVQLQARATMSMADMMASMKMQSAMHMLGPFDELETPASQKVLALFGQPASRPAQRRELEAAALPNRAAEVLALGHEFERRVLDILESDVIDDKAQALDAAVEAYVAERLTVPAEPKQASLLLEHPHGGAFAEGYPLLSRIAWSARWLRLAALEAVIFEEQGSGYWGSVAEVEARFRSKLTSAHHGGGSPAPVELPMTAVIAPTLYTLSPKTAVVLDNLGMFGAIAADLMAWPNLEDRGARIDALVEEFTDHSGHLASPIDYLVSALRGGIYNQGGPAIGELTGSERNRSRMEMSMQHAMIMSSP